MQSNGLPLKNVRDYLQTCRWFQNGLLTDDLTAVLDFLASTPDSRWLIAEIKRAIVLVSFWRQQVEYEIRRSQVQLEQLRDSLDKSVRESLTSQRRVVKSRAVEAGVQSDATFSIAQDSQFQRQRLAGVIDGLEAALDASLIVQESAAARRQEMIDSRV